MIFNSRVFFYLFSIVLAVVSLSSCDKQGPDDPDFTEIVGNSIFVPNSAGETVTVQMEFDEDWYIENDSPWYTVRPMRGSAGTAQITVSVLTDNNDLKERVLGFHIITGDIDNVYYVIQDGVPGFNITESDAECVREGGNLVVTVEGNVKYDVSCEEDWLTVNSVQYDSTLLADGYSYSKYMVSRINVSVEANDSDFRKAYLMLTSNSEDSTKAIVTVEQMGDLVADYGSEFIRRSVVMRMTATWCGYCPFMNYGLEAASEQYPDHIIPINVHDITSEGGLAFPNANDFYTFFDVVSLPEGYVNYYAFLPNISSTARVTEFFEGLAREATSSLPSNTVVGGYASLEDGTISADIYVASKEAGEYALCVYLLEDGIIHDQAYQSGSDEGKDYVHDNVLRASITDNLLHGEAFSAQANGTQKFHFDFSVPYNVENQDNLHIVAFTLREGTYSGSVGAGNVEYKDYGYIVDNAVNMRLGKIENYAYEE